MEAHPLGHAPFFLFPSFFFLIFAFCLLPTALVFHKFICEKPSPLHPAPDKIKAGGQVAQWNVEGGLLEAGDFSNSGATDVYDLDLIHDFR